MPERVPLDRIYLEPGEEFNPDTGRMWCEDDDPAGLGEPWTPYVSLEFIERVIDREIARWAKVGPGAEFDARKVLGPLHTRLCRPHQQEAHDAE